MPSSLVHSAGAVDRPRPAPTKPRPSPGLEYFPVLWQDVSRVGRTGPPPEPHDGSADDRRNRAAGRALGRRDAHAPAAGCPDALVNTGHHACRAPPPKTERTQETLLYQGLNFSGMSGRRVFQAVSAERRSKRTYPTASSLAPQRPRPSGRGDRGLPGQSPTRPGAARSPAAVRPAGARRRAIPAATPREGYADGCGDEGTGRRNRHRHQLRLPPARRLSRRPDVVRRRASPGSGRSRRRSPRSGTRESISSTSRRARS